MAAVSMMAYPARDSFHGYPQQQLGAYQPVTQEPRYHRHQPSSMGSYPTDHYRSTTSSWATARPQVSEPPKPSLPPITDLLDIADRDRSRVDVDRSPPLRAALTRPDRSPYVARALDRQPPSPTPSASSRPRWPDTAAPTSKQSGEPTSSAYYPGPPFRHQSMGERAQSPSTMSTSSASSLATRLGPGATSAVDHRSEAMHGVQASPIMHAPAATMQYAPAYTPPDIPSSATDDPYHQRPLPANFPPHTGPTSGIPSDSVAANPNVWQHHHYIGASTHPGFPPSQDRYICPTCNKAFSRPSSLKIHSHSHTGEKPFRCPHNGCGKAFSVRSNMKRHERGCHGALGFSPSDDSMLDQ